MKIFIFLSLFVVAIMSSSVLAKSETVSPKTYKELSEIQTVMGEGKIDEAFTRLNELLTKVDADSFDQALTLQTLGYVEMAREHFPEAIKHMKASLALNKLPQNMVYQVGYMVAQLYAALGDYDQALEFSRDWFVSLQTPNASQYIFMANIFAQTKHYDEAIPYALKAIEATEKPQETWYQLLISCYFELQNYPKTAKTLQQSLQLWPENSGYWEQLASVYLVQKDYWSALATMKIAFSQQLLQKESSIRSLLQLTVNQGIPEQGARLLEAAMDQEIVPQDVTYLTMLSGALIAAKERDAAILAYQRLASVADDGDAWVSIANLYIEKGQWAEAQAALEKALIKPVKSQGKALLLKGIALAQQKKFIEAKRSFKKSMAFKDTERSASRWLKYTDDMKRQVEWVAQNQ